MLPLNRILYIPILALLLLFAGCNRHQTIQVQFDAVDGLVKGSKVMQYGYDIGEVSGMKLTKEAKIIVDCWLKRDVVIAKDTRFRLRSTDMLGSKVVDVLPGISTEPMPKGQVCMGDTVEETNTITDIATDGTVDLFTYIRKQDSILREVRELNRKVDRLSKRR